MRVLNHPVLADSKNTDKDDELKLAFWLGILRKAYLSQKEYWLVQECGPLFGVCEGSSYQHGLASDATTNPC
jgi:hypothetical protein